jgi:glycosyltransferase involved in cell wall biosynthesis
MAVKTLCSWQPRKRWDLTIKYFGKWIEDNNINNAWLYMHAAPTGDVSVNVIDLARYYNCLDRTVYIETPIFTGLSEEDMCKTYNCFDVCISTTQGEGMGLPAMEAMACGVPCILPDWSAYGDWARDAAVLVPCTSTIGTPLDGISVSIKASRAIRTRLSRRTSLSAYTG